MRYWSSGLVVLAVACGDQFSAEGGTAGAAGAGGTASGSDAGASGGAAGAAGSSGTGGTLVAGGSGGLGGAGGSGGLGGAGKGGTAGAGGSAGASVLLGSCGKQYGTVQFYKLCKENATECHIVAANKVQSCKVVCGSNGGECLDAYDNVDTDPTCGQSTPANCDFTGWYEIVCVCSKGCGSGPPCKYPATCVSGTCV